MNAPAKVWIVYLITCTTTGQQYIGQTSKRVATRWSAHVSHAAKGMTYPLQEAIRAHGEGVFTVATILCCKSKADTDWAEKHLINQYDTLAPKGFNLIAGVGMPGRVVSPVARARHSTTLRELWTDPEYRARNIGNSRKALEIARSRLESALTIPERRAKIARARAGNALKHRTIRDHRQGGLL